MALVLLDRAQQTGTANTTTSFTLSGSVTGFQSLAGVGNGNTTYYSATDISGNWEVGIGTYSTSGPTLTRTTILTSSNSNAAVTFSGTVNVFVTYPSGKSVNLDASGNASSLGTPVSFVGTNITGTASGLSIGGNAATATTATSAGNLTGGTISGNYTVSNATSPNTYYKLFGDNSGWTYRYMTSVSGTPTTRHSWTDTGNYTAVGTISASNFSGSSSGTNTGDQTNISGNAATATAAQNATFLTQPNATWGAKIQLGGNGAGSGVANIATVQATDGNIHLDNGLGKSMYLNYYQNGTIYLNGGSYYISSNGSQYNGNAATATTATTANAVAWGNITSKPSYIMSYQGFTLDANTMGTNQTGFTYSVNAPWTGPIADFSAGGSYDLQINAGYSNTNISYRSRNGDTATWQSWNQFITSANIGSQSVSSATTATSATSATYLNSSNYIQRTGSSGNATTDFQNTPAGSYRYDGDDANLTNSPGGTWWFYENMRHSNSSNYWGTQIAWGWEDNANKLATRNVSGGTFGSWVYYLNSNNYSSYALPLSGGTMSGTIYSSVNSIAIGQSGGVTRGYLYNDSNGMGILSYAGGWGVRVDYGTNNVYAEGALYSNTRIYTGYDSTVTNSISCSNWFRTSGATGLYFASYGRGVTTSDGNVSYGNFATYGSGLNGWQGIGLNNSNNVILMTNASSTGFYNPQTGVWAAIWDLSGNVTWAGNVTAYSDIRLKDNIREIDDPIGRRDTLAKSAIKYEKDGRTRIGYGAQYLRDGGCDEFVHEAENDAYKIATGTGTLSVDYGETTAILAVASKITDDRVDALEARIAQLEEIIRGLTK